MKSVNFGIIGVGRIGQVHLRSFSRLKGAKVLMVADPFGDSAQKAAEAFSVPEWTLDYKDIIKHSEITAVIICSPTNLHAQQIIECAEAGKHAFCEKPIALNMDDTMCAVKAAEKAGIKLMVGFNRRFDDGNKRLREAVVSKQIGDLHRINIVSRDPAPPPMGYIKVSGGIFCDQTIHDFDLARFLVGTDVPVAEVYAAGGCLIDPDIGEAGDFDSALSIVKFQNGVVVSIDNSRKAVYGHDQRVEVFGSNGMAHTNNIPTHNVTVSTSNGIQNAVPQYFFLERYADAYANEMEEFANCILQDGPVPASGLDGQISLAMGLAATKSAKTGLPVKVEY